MDYLVAVVGIALILLILWYVLKNMTNGIRMVEITKEQLLQNMSPDWEEVPTLKERLELNFCHDTGDGTKPIISIGWMYEMLQQLLSEGLIERRKLPQTQEEWEANGGLDAYEHRKVGEATKRKLNLVPSSPAQELLTR